MPGSVSFPGTFRIRAIQLLKGDDSLPNEESHSIKNGNQNGWKHIGDLQFQIEDHVDAQAQDH